MICEEKGAFLDCVVELIITVVLCLVKKSALMQLLQLEFGKHNMLI